MDALVMKVSESLRFRRRLIRERVRKCLLLVVDSEAGCVRHEPLFQSSHSEVGGHAPSALPRLAYRACGHNPPRGTV